MPFTSEILTNFSKNNNQSERADTIIEEVTHNSIKVKKYTNEYWTSKQRQANSLHEVSYRACFKPQLPKFFIENYTREKDVVYDPFSGRGTTVLEAALLNRNIIANDVNPLSTIFTKARLHVPNLDELAGRLEQISFDKTVKPEINLEMFYHKDTLQELLSIRNYLLEKNANHTIDELDQWIQMVATNRLTGHSSGFFSVYTLPPNQAVSQESQIKINKQRNQKPPYRNTKQIIIKKTKQLIKGVTETQKQFLRNALLNGKFYNEAADNTKDIKEDSVALTVTSPPFLDVVQYAHDNWLRCWFNNIDAEEVSKKITMAKKVEEWEAAMGKVFEELFRITKQKAHVAFEVGEVRNGKIKLDEHVVELGIAAGFKCEAIMINEQTFTKTSNIWGISNNKRGTNSNRIVIFKK